MAEEDLDGLPARPWGFRTPRAWFLCPMIREANRPPERASGTSGFLRGPGRSWVILASLSIAGAAGVVAVLRSKFYPRQRAGPIDIRWLKSRLRRAMRSTPSSLRPPANPVQLFLPERRMIGLDALCSGGTAVGAPHRIDACSLRTCMLPDPAP